MIIPKTKTVAKRLLSITLSVSILAIFLLSHSYIEEYNSVEKKIFQVEDGYGFKVSYPGYSHYQPHTPGINGFEPMDYETANTLAEQSQRNIQLELLRSFVASAAGDEWIRKAAAPGEPRRSAVGFSIGDKGYMGMGVGDKSGLYTDFWEYDPINDTWTRKADYGGGGNINPTAFSIGNKGYVLTGTNLNTYSRNNPQGTPTFWEYDPATNVWTQKSDTADGGNVGFSIGDRGYLVNTGSRKFNEYDPVNDTWTPKSDFDGATRHGPVGFSINGKGYVGTGRGEAFYNDFWEYDPTNNTWTRKADAGGGTVEGVGFSIGDKGYIGTGFDRLGRKHDYFWEYNSLNDTWDVKEPIGVIGRSLAIGFSIGDKGYMGTGEDVYFKPNNNFLEYIPAQENINITENTTQNNEIVGSSILDVIKAILTKLFG
ncbi:MAG: hypothetical protein Q7J10_08965 [Methanosarcinaceae archaeon]|nr:hypothetical protein [Methanosarcinaceae archaeon]